MKKIYLSLFLCFFSITLTQAMEEERFQRGDTSKQAQKKPRISSAQESITAEQPAFEETIIRSVPPALVEDTDDETELLTSLLPVQEPTQEKAAFIRLAEECLQATTHTIKLENFSPELKNSLQQFLMDQFEFEGDAILCRDHSILGFIEEVFSVLPIKLVFYDWEKYNPFDIMSALQIDPKQAFFIGALIDQARRLRIFLYNLYSYTASQVEEKNKFIEKNSDLYRKSLNPQIVANIGKFSFVRGGNYVRNYFHNYYLKVLEAAEEFNKKVEAITYTTPYKAHRKIYGEFKFPPLPPFDYSEVAKSKIVHYTN